MKNVLTFIILILLFGCGKQKSVLLPEIENAKVTKITDVSPAYLFYDETKPDSLELNRGNLIISTNWLVNIDKRLTLKQIIPSLIMLQEKKLNSEHKNENARNYYTCNDTSIKNLGFIDFTDVVYITDKGLASDLNSNKNAIHLKVINTSKIQIIKANKSIVEADVNSFIEKLNFDLDKNEAENVLTLGFYSDISFQNYITVKSMLLNAGIKNLIITNSEFILD